MQFTPSQAASHLKESIASYIESQYRIWVGPLTFERKRYRTPNLKMDDFQSGVSQ